MIIGVDLGNYGVKTSERKSFLSKVSEIENSFNNENLVCYENERIFVGEGEFSTDWNKAAKETTLQLLYTALARSSDEQFFQVVVGLPIEQYKKNKLVFKELIENNTMKLIEIEGCKKEIVITDIEIAPECAAAYYNLSKENIDLIGNKPLVIVDIGGRTTDVCLFSSKKIEKVKTISVGMLNVYDDVVSHINNEYTISLKLEEAENILKDGLFLDGENKDISFIKPILQRHFNSIYKDLQLNFELAKGYVLLTGGGSIKFRQAFKNRLKNVILSDDPIFDNAVGFKILGKKLFGGN